MQCIVGDIWLSLRFRPPVTVSDTACTFSANLSNIDNSLIDLSLYFPSFAGT